VTASSKNSIALSPVVRRFIAEAGGATQALGFGRAVGQIYAFLYFTDGPRCLNDLQEALGISKGSASMSVRQLEQWEAVRKVWIRGDRKDYYEASPAFGAIIRRVLADTFATKMNSASNMLEEALAEARADGEYPAFTRERLEHLEAFRDRAAKVWENPILQHLLR
jgi:DNA-binding transcriptional regulator GbsR (MarR family)